MIEHDHAQISVSRQCELLSLHRSGLYYQPVTESDQNLAIMRLLDEQLPFFLCLPYYTDFRWADTKVLEWIDTKDNILTTRIVQEKQGQPVRMWE